MPRGEHRLAEAAGVDERLGRVDVRLQSILKAHAELDAGAVHLFEQRIDASGRDVDRFLDEHVQARCVPPRCPARRGSPRGCR